jgi:hypothetical protein
VKVKVIPISTEASGTISKSLRQYLSNIPGKHEIKELQETAVLVTAYILLMRDNITCSTNCKNRTAETQYTPETWPVTGI